MKMNTLVVVVGSVILQSCASLGTEISSASDFDKTADFYQSMIDREQPEVSKLNLFLTKMPKGGDIHHHYSGTVYAESYLDWVKFKGWTVNKCTLEIIKTTTKTTKKCPDLTVEQVYKDNDVYRQLLSLWSDKDYSNHYHQQPAPDTNFFNTFDYFADIAHEYTDLGLHIIKQRAINENVGYIETMLSTVGANSSDYFDKKTEAKLIHALVSASTEAEFNEVFDIIHKRLSSDSQFNELVKTFTQSVEKYHRQIDDDQFTMRYQTYAVRVLNPLQVFTDLYSGYLAADQSPLVVGVNIVAPENNVVALADYTLHMKMYAYLLKKYPKVNRALHAGELTLGMVRPRNLVFHIDQALNIAQAQRIGHGVDLPYENNSVSLVTQISERSVIEINLTSNQFILGVEKQDHPYTIYSSYNVPLVIATDDSGVSRNNLTNEYMLLASRYRPNYETVKRYVYNSINYSFMNDQDKAENIKRLDNSFLTFEREMAELSDKMM